jgi:hypothetical protein
MRELYLDPETAHWLFLIDVFWAHRSPEFITWIQQNFKTVILVYVPANCTPVLQPLDVLFNSAWKQFVSSLCATWLMKQVKGKYIYIYFFSISGLLCCVQIKRQLEVSSGNIIIKTNKVNILFVVRTNQFS